MIKRLPFDVVKLQDVGEDIFLHLGIVDTNGSATDLDAIQNKVVMLTPDLIETTIKQSRDVLPHGGCEGMVCAVFVMCEQWKLCDPEKVGCGRKSQLTVCLSQLR